MNEDKFTRAGLEPATSGLIDTVFVWCPDVIFIGVEFRVIMDRQHIITCRYREFTSSSFFDFLYLSSCFYTRKSKMLTCRLAGLTSNVNVQEFLVALCVFK